MYGLKVRVGPLSTDWVWVIDTDTGSVLEYRTFNEALNAAKTTWSGGWCMANIRIEERPETQKE